MVDNRFSADAELTARGCCSLRSCSMNAGGGVGLQEDPLRHTTTRCVPM
jgi:hypothetical protein